MIFLLAILLIEFCIISYQLTDNDVFSPSFLFSLGFGVCVMSACLFARKWKYDVSSTTFSIIALGGALFIVAGFLTNVIANRRRGAVSKVDESERDVAFPAMSLKTWTEVALLALMLSVFIWSAFKIRAMFPSESFGESIRQYNYAATFSTDNVGFGFPLGILRGLCCGAGFLVAFLLAQEIMLRRGHRILLLVLSLLCAMGIFWETGNRTGVIEYIFTFVLCLLWVRRRCKELRVTVTKKDCSLIVALVIILLGAFQASAGSRAAGYDPLDYLSVYVGAEIPNLDHFIGLNHFGASIPFGKMTFVNTINYFGNKLDIASWVYTLDLPFNEINGYGLGNVYTTYYAFLYDFGYIGLFVLTCIMAVVATLIYRKATVGTYKRGADIWIIVYSIVGYSLLMSFFSNKFYEDVFSIQFVTTLVYYAIARFLMLAASGACELRFPGKRPVF